MNIIKELFNEEYIINLFKKKVLPLYPDFFHIKKVKIIFHKNYVWESTYHVVVEFATTFKTRDKKNKALSIFCSAHSDEPRKNVYDALKYLWDSGFSKGYLTIPHPLFYSKKHNAIFYRGVNGRNLYQYIRKKDYENIEAMVPKAASWFAKLHNLPTENAKNYNPLNSKIETVIPGVPHILERIKEDYPEYSEAFKKLYKNFTEKENEFLSSTRRRWLVHGDAHGENVIKMGQRKIGVIDFTDLCLSDFARDVGTFLQQLEFMIMRKIDNQEYAKKMKKVFLDNYLVNATINIDKEEFARIENYYNWTAIRTATFFLLKHNAEPERAYPIIRTICKKLNINCP